MHVLITLSKCHFNSTCLHNNLYGGGPCIENRVELGCLMDFGDLCRKLFLFYNEFKTIREYEIDEA